jgi:DNA-binding GntR family transcriptional regulator
MFGVDCAQSGAQSVAMVLKKMRNPAKLVGLSNPANRPKVASLDDIYDHIVASIVDQRLPPGTKLNELMLCDIFNVGRRQIAQVLVRLNHDRLVDLHPNRGAFVAAPDVAEARAIFEARRAIEIEIVRAAALKMTREQLAVLKRNVEQEAACRRAGRIRDAIRLSGEFHTLLGGFSGNPILARMIAQLVARTSLVVSLYENQNTMSCWHDDHRLFIRHLEARAVAPAAALMRKHLLHIEESLNLDQAPPAPFDLRAIYAPPAGQN